MTNEEIKAECERLARLAFPQSDVTAELNGRAAAVFPREGETARVWIHHERSSEALHAALLVLAGEPDGYIGVHAPAAEPTPGLAKDEQDVFDVVREYDVPAEMSVPQFRALVAIVERLRATAAEATARANELPGMSAALDEARFAVGNARKLVAEWRARVDRVEKRRLDHKQPNLDALFGLEVAAEELEEALGFPLERVAAVSVADIKDLKERVLSFRLPPRPEWWLDELEALITKARGGA